VLLLWGLARGPREKIGKPQLVATAIFGCALFLGGHGSLAWAQQKIPSGVAALIIATIPLWVAIFDASSSGSGWRAARSSASRSASAGSPSSSTRWAAARSRPAAALVALFAAASWAGGSLYSRDAPMPQNAMVAAGLASLFGGVALLAGAGVRGEYSGFDLSQVSAASAFGEAYVIVMGSFVGLTSYVWLLRTAPISLVATYAYVNPVIAVLIGSLFLDETLPASILIAGAAIVAAVAMIVSAPAPARSYGARAAALGAARRAGRSLAVSARCGAGINGALPANEGGTKWLTGIRPKARPRKPQARQPATRASRARARCRAPGATRRRRPRRPRRRRGQGPRRRRLVRPHVSGPGCTSRAAVRFGGAGPA
jgi:drug/metabolite transporter (DMT)-like permease